MATLDRWRPYLTAPKKLVFPRLELKGRDWEPPIVVGAGEVHILSLTRSEYVLTGTPGDWGYAFSEIRRQQDNPYDGLARFRLEGTDSDGVQWTLGWTIPQIDIGEGEPWTFRGVLEGLMPEDKSDTVSPISETEVIFAVPVDHPMAPAMGRFVLAGHSGGRARREHTMEVLGSTIRFAYEPGKTVAITASHTKDLPPTLTENWLGEPLRIIFGQLVYPRLVARNLGDGRTIVSIRSSPALVRGAGWAALWQGDGPAMDKTTFWRLYADLLTFVALERDADGHANFEANKVTRLYEEIIQAARGTRWVWALTFASSIEALTTTLIPVVKSIQTATTRVRQR